MRDNRNEASPEQNTASVDCTDEEGKRRDSTMTETATTALSAVPTIVSGKILPAVPETIVGKSLCDMSETAMVESQTVAIAPVIAGSTPPILSFMRDRLRYENNDSDTGGTCSRQDR